MAAALVCAAPALAFVIPDIGPLSKLERGRWVVREIEGPQRHSLCLGSSTALVQLEHRGVACSGEILATDGSGGTIHYTCPGRGFAQTSVHVETPRLARIDTQGLLDGRPFAYRAEARRVGAC